MAPDPNKIPLITCPQKAQLKNLSTKPPLNSILFPKIFLAIVSSWHFYINFIISQLTYKYTCHEKASTINEFRERCPLHNISLPIYECHIPPLTLVFYFPQNALQFQYTNLTFFFTIFIPMYLMFLGVITNDITKISLFLSCKSIEIELIFYTDLQFRDHIKYVYYI